MKAWIRKHYFGTVAVGACLTGLILLFMFWRFMDQYEEGVLEVCAEQQDAYVQLVLDQIYIRNNARTLLSLKRSWAVWMRPPTSTGPFPRKRPCSL